MQTPKITCHKLWRWLPSDCKITDLASPQMNCSWFRHDYKRGVELQCALFIPFVWRSSSSALLWCLNLLANAYVSSWKKTKPLPHAKTAEDKTDTQSQSSDVVCLFSAQPLCFMLTIKKKVQREVLNRHSVSWYLNEKNLSHVAISGGNICETTKTKR